MNPAIPLLVLLGAEPEVGDRPTLERFSTRWSVQFAPTRALRPEQPPEAALPRYPTSAPIVARIEELLDAARHGAARLDETESREALSAAERLLIAHPELPQAAWLQAERLTLAAELLEATGGLGAAELRQRARALEGPRSSPFQGRDPAPPIASTEVVHPVTISGLGPRDTLEWDGVRATPPFSALAGEHHVRVLRRGFAIRAAWVSVDDRAATIALELPTIEPCSAEDLAGTRPGPSGPRAEPGVACPSWAVARRERGELELALCRRTECGRWYRLAPQHEEVPARPASPAVSRGLPAWATVALASAGAALATSFVLWQTGVFEPEPATRERWLYRGLDR